MKATEIITAKSKGIVCILGGFHLLMSFFGQHWGSHEGH